MQYPVFEPGMHRPEITIPPTVLGCPSIDYYYLKSRIIDQSENRPPLVKKIKALLGGGDSFKKDKRCSTAYDLVQQMKYLYVRVVKAQGIALFGRFELFGEVNVGNFKGITKMASMSNPKWDQVFAFSRDCIKSATKVEIFVKERYQEKYIGRIWFDLSEVPNRVPTDSQLEPQRYKMEEDNKGDKAKSGELMLSIWFGTQADEAFSEAWHSTAANVPYGLLSLLKSQIYFSPKLWCLRVLIIEAQDIMPGHRGSDVVRFPEFSAKVQLGDKCLGTKNAAPSATRSFSNPYWNEELFFVVAEPFENDLLLVTVEDQVELLGGMDVARVLLPVATIEKRADEKIVNSKWFDLDSDSGNTGDDKNKPITRFVSRIHLRVFFDGGHSLVDEDTVNISSTTDVSPSDKRLVKPPHIGVLGVGILGASGLQPMTVNRHGGGETGAYCVAYYGDKLFRTRTVVDNMSPRWNEQYVWEVYDPCTVVTIAVFQNHRISKNKPHNNNDASCDYRYGKVRIRLSTLENDRVYSNSYPLLIFDSSGLKKMGELQLAVKFSYTNLANMLCKYTTPKLPKMHCVHPLSVNELRMLRHEAVNVVASKLSRVEPPLDEGAVKYTLCHDSSQMWSMRKMKAAFFRMKNVLSCLIAMLYWLHEIGNWEKPVYSALFLIIFLGLVMLPGFIIPLAIFFYLAFLGLWKYRYRPQHPPCLDITLSCANSVNLGDLDEELDTIPTTTRSINIVRWRYDRLRTIVGRLQNVAGDIATMFERFQALVSWEDPRATFLFVMFCLVASGCFYVVPIRVVLALWGLYLLRPPWLRRQLPSPALAFFQRLPSRVDCLISETVGMENREIEGLLMSSMVEDFQQCIKLFV